MDNTNKILLAGTISFTVIAVAIKIGDLGQELETLKAEVNAIKSDRAKQTDSSHQACRLYTSGPVSIQDHPNEQMIGTVNFGEQGAQINGAKQNTSGTTVYRVGIADGKQVWVPENQPGMRASWGSICEKPVNKNVNQDTSHPQADGANPWLKAVDSKVSTVSSQTFKPASNPSIVFKPVGIQR